MAAGSDGNTTRQQARLAFEGLRAAMLDAAATFDREAEVIAKLLVALDHEPSITALTSGYPIAQERERLTLVLDAYETHRRDARIELWRVMLDEGCSIGEVSRIFGLSRQLVSRQLQDNPQP
ncbi:MAG: hypothetical protein ACXVH5_04925 [Ilumatobacteraceae bacterium]